MTVVKTSFPMQQMKNQATEERVATALEFIAHYLDRIDSHLEQLAKAVPENKGAVVGISHQLASIAKAISTHR
jgi:hypothetical protein